MEHLLLPRSMIVWFAKVEDDGHVPDVAMDVSSTIHKKRVSQSFDSSNAPHKIHGINTSAPIEERQNDHGAMFEH